VAGTYTFTVTVTDAENPAVTAAGQLSITVSGPVITGLNPGQGPSFGGFLIKITGTGLSCPRPGGFFCRVSVMFGTHRAFVLGRVADPDRGHRAARARDGAGDGQGRRGE
jgi:hypothetical protein